MRRSRGNIILTALFIAIFLFFLSVALIWTNRQDIALSLSMEHKLKAQSAARSAAYEAYYRLRKQGTLAGFSQGTLSNGVEYDVELVGKEASNQRGEVLLVRARGKSGPVTSYLTLHLLDVSIAGKENEERTRVLFFPGAGGSEEGAQAEQDEAAATVEGGGGSALFGDFKLAEGGPGLISGIMANQGPAFVAEEGEVEPPSFYDYIPAFTGTFLQAWGPVQVVAPAYPTLSGSRTTTLRTLEYKGDEFIWKVIEPPEDLGDPLPEGAIDLFEMGAPNNSTWTNASVLIKNVFTGLDYELCAISTAWKVKKPPAEDPSDIENPLYTAEPQPVGPLVDWSSVRSPGKQEKFQTRGAAYPVKQSVYSHGWHLLYQPHDGSFPSPPTVLDGSMLTRWPCVLKFTIGGKWEKVWTPLDSSGAVTSVHRPDPRVLAVTSTGVIYSATEPEEGQQRRLLTLDGRNAILGDPLPEGKLIVYNDQPYLVSEDPEEPPLRHLAGAEHIDFESLPELLPEIHGEVVDVSGTEKLILGIGGGYAGEPLDSTRRLSYTARPRYDFTYSLDPASPIAVDGSDLWAVVNVLVEESEPSAEKGYLDGPYREGTKKTLARYDGKRWHILPNGLRALLRSSDLGAPGAGVVSANYPGLPPQQSRYTVISVSTNPF
ncbi:MAG: hypothetical protein WC314_01595 [Vulcanimicrobiota bacterium]